MKKVATCSTGDTRYAKIEGVEVEEPDLIAWKGFPSAEFSVGDRQFQESEDSSV